MKRKLISTLVDAALAVGAGAASAQISDDVIKIGVMSDMSSLYAEIGGPGSTLAARMAVEDFGAAKKGMKVEVVSADAPLAIGKTDALADARRAARGARTEQRLHPSEAAASLARGASSGAQVGMVTGELRALPAATLPLAELDDYEGFRLGRPSLFVRVLVEVSSVPGDDPGHAWTYVAGRLMEGAPLIALLEQEEYHEERTAFLKSKGYRILRFGNNDVMNNTDSVLTMIWDTLKA